MATIEILQVSSINDGVEDWESPYISTTVLETGYLQKVNVHLVAGLQRWPPSEQ